MIPRASKGWTWTVSPLVIIYNIIEFECIEHHNYSTFDQQEEIDNVNVNVNDKENNPYNATRLQSKYFIILFWML